MNAWLLTWESIKKAPKEELVAIYTSRRSEYYIAELMEFIVQRAKYGASDMAYFANRRKKLIYKSKHPLLINNVPVHGELVIQTGIGS